MKVVAFASQKGGSGKTTLAAHVAVQAEMSGAGPVALMDTDPQGSLTDWWNERESQTPVFAQASVARLVEHVEEMREQGIKLLVIDTPPAITSGWWNMWRRCASKASSCW
jgi:chromosome partitioning protein